MFPTHSDTGASEAQLKLTTSTGVEPPAPRPVALTQYAPLHVSLVAVLVMALLVGWDRRNHGGHHLRPR